MRFVPALAICGLLGASAPLLAKSDPFSGWVKASTPECVVITDLSTKTAADIAAQYTVFRRTVFDLLAPPGHKPPPALLFIVSNDRVFKQVVGNHTSGDSDAKTVSWSTNLGTTPLMMVSYESRGTTIPMMYEFDVSSTVPRMGYYAPLWVAQGTGEVFSSCTITDSKIVVGEENYGVSEIWQNKSVLHWSHFFEMSSGSKDYAGKNSDGMYQAQAWVLMHAILMTDKGPSMRERMVALDKALRQNGESSAAVADVLGINPADLEDTVNHHWRHLPTLTFPSHLKEIKAAIHTQPVPRVEMQAYCADIEATTGNPDQADLDIDEALVAAPDDPIVNEAMAWRHFRQNEMREAVRFFQKAIEKGPTMAEDFTFTALQQLNDNGDESGAGGPAVEPAIDELHQALKFDSANPYIYLQLSRAYNDSPTATQAQADELLAGAGDDDIGLRVEYNRALILKRLGNLEQYKEALRHVAKMSPDEKLKTFAAEELDRDRINADAKQIQQLANAHDFDGALALVDKGWKDVGTDFGRNNYDRLKKQVLQMKEATELFALFNAKDYEGFLKRAPEFVHTYPKNPNTNRLKSMMQKAQEATEEAEVSPLPVGALDKLSHGP